MVQCKRFRWEDEFNEWARKEKIQGYHVVAIKHSPPDSMMIFYDKSLKEKTSQPIYYYGGGYDWTSPHWTYTTTTTGNPTITNNPTITMTMDKMTTSDNRFDASTTTAH